MPSARFLRVTLGVWTLSLCLALLVACQQKPSLPQVSAGQLIRWPEVTSQFIAARHVDIWLPPGYDSTQHYPVLYVHDGQMLFDSTQTWNGQDWQIDEVCSQLIAAGRMRPAIVVGIWNDAKERHADYFPQAPFESLPEPVQDSLLKIGWESPLFATPVKSDGYLRFIVEELKPRIDQTFATQPEAANTFVMGSSMGGLISWYAMCEYPEVFGGAACLSTHWPGTFTVEGNPIPEAFFAYLREHLPPPRTHRIYFDHGTATLDSLYPPLQRVANQLVQAAGYDSLHHMQSMVFLGQDHAERAWARRVHLPLQFLLGEN
ncbi:MAG: esterase family protein [Bacteroidetes bacterium]|nr:MAG: esterase family protein [Bacteroidota bacterium]